MSSRPGNAQRVPTPADARPLHCEACESTLGSAVAFCPFCGVKQAKSDAAALRPTVQPTVQPQAPQPPEPQPAAAPLAVAEPASPGRLGGSLAPVPVKPRAAPPLPAAPAAAVPLRAKPVPSAGGRPPLAKRRGGFRRLLGLVGVVFVAAAGLRAMLPPAPKAVLTVRVHGPGGALLTSGHILVNGQDAGVPGQSIRVAPGGLTVAFEQPGWASAPRSLTVAKDAEVVVDLNASEALSHLAVTSNPAGATIRIQGRSYGQTPTSLDLVPGSYEVVLQLPGYAARTMPVVLARGETRQVSADLLPVQPTPPVRFAPANFERGVVTVPAPLLAAPARGSNAVATLPALTEVQVLAQADAEEGWLQVRAGDRTGYLPAVGVVEAWDYWAMRYTVSGPFEAVVPHLRVSVGGRTLALADVQMPDRGGYSASGLARVEAGLGERLRGQPVRCVPRTTTAYLCKTDEGRDLAEAMVLVGAAVASRNAPPYYFESQQVAQGNGRGLWSNQ